MDDSQLVERCVDGDAVAWELLVRRHVDLLYHVVRTAGAGWGDREVEDVVQEVFLKLWEDGRRRLRTFQGKCRLSTWLAVVARREARAYSAKRRAPGPARTPKAVALLDAAQLLDEVATKGRGEAEPHHPRVVTMDAH